MHLKAIKPHLQRRDAASTSAEHFAEFDFDMSLFIKRLILAQSESASGKQRSIPK
jgi:hypothetical protein